MRRGQLAERKVRRRGSPIRPPATELETRGRELDKRLTRFVQRLQRRQLEGVEMRHERLHVAALKAVAPAEA